jgi:hypothetical protein
MSKKYQFELTVTEFNSEKQHDIITGLITYFLLGPHKPFDDLFEKTCECRSQNIIIFNWTECNLEKISSEFIHYLHKEISRVVWEAIGDYCRVRMTYHEIVPTLTKDLETTHDNYQKWQKFKVLITGDKF